MSQNFAIVRVAALLHYRIYTIPEVSLIGMTEEDEKRIGIYYEVEKSRYADSPRGKIIDITNAEC